MPAGASLRKVNTLTSAELKAMIFAFLSQASLEYLHNKISFESKGQLLLCKCTHEQLLPDSRCLAQAMK